MLSFWKAFVNWPSLSVNGIFDDVRNDVIMTSYPRNDVAVLAKFSNGTVRWSVRMTHAKNYEAVTKFVKVMPVASFFPDTVYIAQRARSCSVSSSAMRKTHYTRFPVASPYRRGSCQHVADLLRRNWCPMDFGLYRPKRNRTKRCVKKNSLYIRSLFRLLQSIELS